MHCSRLGGSYDRASSYHCGSGDEASVSTKKRAQSQIRKESPRDLIFSSSSAQRRGTLASSSEIRVEAEVSRFPSREEVAPPLCAAFSCIYLMLTLKVVKS